MVTGTKHPRLIFSIVTGTKHPRPIFSMVTGTSLGYLPLLFSYSVYIGCVVLLRVHLKISTCKMFFFNIFTLLMFKIRQQLTKIKSINRFVITCGYFVVVYFWFCEFLSIIPDLKYLYCDMNILMNYLFNPYMSNKSYFSKEPIFWLFKPPLECQRPIYKLHVKRIHR